MAVKKEEWCTGVCGAMWSSQLGVLILFLKDFISSWIALHP
jgi:hypothetical protein